MAALGAALGGCGGGGGAAAAAAAGAGAAAAAPSAGAADVSLAGAGAASGGGTAPASPIAATGYTTPSIAPVLAATVSASNASGAGAAHKAPAIAGTPPAVVAAGTPYAFEPTVTAAAGARLTFSIANKPAWAIFSTTSGALSGNPAAADVGTFGGITISVSDGTSSVSLAPFQIAVTPATSAITLSWTPPTQNTNGTTITDLAGYHVYYGTKPSNLTTMIAVDAPSTTSRLIGNLTAGTWYFAVAAVNSEKIESALSAILALDVVPAGGAGGGGAPTPVSVDLASSANVDAVANAGARAIDGGLDAKGDAYAASALGASLNWSGAEFTLPAAGSVGAVSSTTIALPEGNFASLQFLATATNGNQAKQSFVVAYTDGSTSTIEQSLSDWHTPQNFAGEAVARTMSERINGSGAADARGFNLYGYGFAIDATKTVKSLTLPKNRDVVVLAVTLTTP
jgi:hypothetical protein